uniref:Putative plant transposon protein domain-containing protein n=1 Tax=Solanum tuberosum TaxID=4113 RepID=M1DMH6_SOLTU
MALVDYIEVQGKKVLCSESDIYDLLDYTTSTTHTLMNKVKTKTLDDLKGWLAPLFNNITPPCLDTGVLIEKKDQCVVARYWFGFISSSLMPSQNESIIRHPNATLLGVPFVARTNIEAEYTKDEAKCMKATPIDTSLMINVEDIEADGPQSTPVDDLTLSVVTNTDDLHSAFDEQYVVQVQ